MLTQMPEFAKDEVAIFNIINYYPSWAHFPGAQWGHSDGFGLVHSGNDGRQVIQGFSFEVLGQGGMEKWMGNVDIGGYFFHVFKSHPIPIAAGFLEGKMAEFTGENDQDSPGNRISLGFGHHSSRYQPCAHEEALKYAYTECYGIACKIAMEKRLPLVEVLHDYLIRKLSPDEYKYGEKPLFGTMDLLVRSLEAEFKHREAELADTVSH